MASSKDVIHSKLWQEESEPGDPFTATACYCSGYDVYGELLHKASYVDYLYLLFRRERPLPNVARALEILTIALGNPGPRDPSVHAAMSAGVGGSPAAAALMAALAAGAGSSGGAREVLLAMEVWTRCGCDLNAWQTAIASPPVATRQLVWPDIDHFPGFSPYARDASIPVRQTLEALADCLPDGCARWLLDHRQAIENLVGLSLAMPGVAAAALIDMGITPEAGEMLTLLLRLPGAAAHALEQGEMGFRRFPFFSLDISNDPGPAMPKEGTAR